MSDAISPSAIFAGMEHAHVAMYYSDLLEDDMSFETPRATVIMMPTTRLNALDPSFSYSSCLCQMLGFLSIIIAGWALALARRRPPLTVIDAQPLSKNNKETHAEV